MVKVYIDSKETGNLSANSDTIVVVNTPSELKSLLAIIPISVSVTSTWSAYATIAAVDMNTKAIGIHTHGSGSQNYVLRYALLYK